MSLGLQVMFTAELAGPGVQWDTISTLPSTDENLHLGHVCIMLAIDIFLYMIIAWYFLSCPTCLCVWDCLRLLLAVFLSFSLSLSLSLSLSVCLSVFLSLSLSDCRYANTGG